MYTVYTIFEAMKNVYHLRKHCADENLKCRKLKLDFLNSEHDVGLILTYLQNSNVSFIYYDPGADCWLPTHSIQRCSHNRIIKRIFTLRSASDRMKSNTLNFEIVRINSNFACIVQSRPFGLFGLVGRVNFHCI